MSDEGQHGNGASPNFSYLRQYVPTETAEYELFELEGVGDECPVLIVKCAADNTAYLEALKQHRQETNRKVERMRRGKNKRLRPGEVMNELLAEIDLKVYPGTIIVDWRNVVDTNHEAVPFTVENCAAFLQALPHSIFEGVRAFCSDPRNFRAGADDSDENTEALAGNS